MATALDDLAHAGRFTGGVYGALRLLTSLVKHPDIRPGRIVAFFDNGVPARRKQLLPGYKSERKHRQLLEPEQMERAMAQVGDCWRLFPYLGIVCLSFREREADDGIGGAARLLDGQQPIVVSSDRDLWQTILWGADVWDLRLNAWVTMETMPEHIGGVPPPMYLLYKVLVGDPSDSIAGAKGCGPKRAAQIVLEYAGDVRCLDNTKTSPRALIGSFTAWLQRRGPKYAFEHAIVADAARLSDVAEGVYLGCPWPGDQMVTALQRAPEVDQRGFLGACGRLGFQSVLGDPERYLRPMREAAARRDTVPAEV